MKNVIVGTAGHIDHGKSALVKALTGTDPDRLKEEKARGITIDLGFAHLQLDGVQIGFVDVPGHEKFVKNMLAGVGGIDIVMLVVAADESVMPQTREHFDICRLLGIRTGIVVITKTDLADSELVTLVREEVSEMVRGSFLDGAPILAVSSRTGAGMDHLKAAFRQIAMELPERPSNKRLRLPIDRSFTMHGFGTVITGTLIAGRLIRDGEVELLPGGRIARVRGIQIHGMATEMAVAGQRTAVNLQGVELSQVKRGMVLTEPRLYRATQLLDAKLTLLPGARPLKNLIKVRFHLGTSEVLARVALLGIGQLAPGAAAFAQFRLDAPVFCLHGDPFIIRQFSPTVTIGGGKVLNPHTAKHRARDKGVIANLEELSAGDYSGVIPQLIRSHPVPAMPLKELNSYVDLPAADLERICSGLAADGHLVMIPGPSTILMPPRVVESLQSETLHQVQRCHEQSPLAKGISREELRKKVFDRLNPEVFRFCLDELVAQKKIALLEDAVSAHGRTVQLSAGERQLRERIEEAFLRGGFQPPTLQDIQASVGGNAEEIRRIYFWMIKEKILVKVTEEMPYHRTTVEEIKAAIRRRFQPGTLFGVPAFKELFNLTRKHAIPLLEYLDREHITRRQGNDRVLL